MSGSKYIDRIIAAVGEEKVFRNEDMSRHTTFRIGGPADCLVQPESAEELREILRICKEENVPYFILGNGSNLLVSDSGYRGLIIQLFRNMSGIEISGDIITAQTGSLLTQIASAAAGAELTGFEFASGIPGTLGGACVMNAGAYGGEMKDVLISVTAMAPEGRTYTIDRDDLDLGLGTTASGDGCLASNTADLPEQTYRMPEWDCCKTWNPCSHSRENREFCTAFTNPDSAEPLAHLRTTSACPLSLPDQVVTFAVSKSTIVS